MAKKIIDMIIFIYNKMHEDHFRPLLLISKAIGLIDMIGEHINDNKENNHNSYDQNIFLEITSYISKNYDKKITIDLICKEVGISRNKCCELFLQFTKDTLLNYLTRYRIYKSMEYLRNTHLSILEISQMCGFSTPSYFTSVFKKEKVMTPKEYRLKP